ASPKGRRGLGKRKGTGAHGPRAGRVRNIGLWPVRPAEIFSASCPCSSNLAKSMAKRTARTRKTSRFTAAGGRTAVQLSQVTRFGRAELLILLGLAVVTFGIYAQVIGHQFITLDDPTYVQENPMVNRGVTGAGLVWAFTTFYATNWHPLTWISHMIDCQLFGTNAGGHLLLNALIHAANTLLVFWFLLRTTRARWPSALLAAFFVLSRLRVDSVS